MFECTAKMSFSEWMARRDEVIQRHEVVKIGRVELFPEEAQEAYERGLYIVALHRGFPPGVLDPLQRRPAPVLRASGLLQHRRLPPHKARPLHCHFWRRSQPPDRVQSSDLIPAGHLSRAAP